MAWWMSRARFTGLWRHPDFLKLWAAQSVSQFGTQVTLLAIPLTAALTLDVSPGQMGLLTAAGTAPFLLIGLFAGVVVDRSRRRPILMWTDIGRGVLLAAVPIAAWLDMLRIELLYLVEFTVGMLTVFFEVSYQSYLPSLVERRHLVEGNSKLETSRAGAQILGPGIAGGLIQFLGAPIAIVVDIVSFVLSGALLASIRRQEPPPEPRTAGQSVRADISEGIRLIAHHRLLRPIAACTATSNLFNAMLVAVIVLYLTRTLDLEPGMIGVIFAAGSVGFLLGAVTAARVAQRFGLGWTIAGGVGIGSLGFALIPAATGPTPVVIGMLIVAMFVSSWGGAVYNINQVSLRQSITPDRLLGRMNATMRFVVWGTLPIGSLAGGAIAELIGLRPTLWISVAGSSLAVLWVLLSDVRALREQPAAWEPEPAVAAA